MKSDNSPTFYFHDYETFGANPTKDRASQFAGVRTDMDLNIIEEPATFYCKLAPDYLPSPEAILITGITPQLVNVKGIPETEFMGKIQQVFSQTNTCVVGYNSLRFDDEVTRFGFYRNFIDPYAREWQQGNSRWDIIDLVRACYALRPAGITWRYKEDGTPSFKLEHLTVENNLTHDKAHDAMSDVYATIAMAKLIKEKQPKLFQYYLSLRRKQEVSKQLDVIDMTPLVHISGKISSAKGCCTLIAPIAFHPDNKNSVICVNLAMDITPLLTLSADDIRERLYTAHQDLSEHELPIPLKQIHINKCPFIAPAKTLTDDIATRLNFDKSFARKQYKLLRQHPEIRQKLSQVFESKFENEITDPDLMLYSGGFFSAADKAKMEIIRNTLPQNLAAIDLQFDDPRIKEMLFRFRARNYPETLSEQEVNHWKLFCQSRLDDTNYVIKLENMMEEYQHDEKKLKLLTTLVQYLQSL